MNDKCRNITKISAALTYEMTSVAKDVLGGRYAEHCDNLASALAVIAGTGEMICMERCGAEKNECFRYYIGAYGELMDRDESKMPLRDSLKDRDEAIEMVSDMICGLFDAYVEIADIADIEVKNEYEEKYTAASRAYIRMIGTEYGDGFEDKCLKRVDEKLNEIESELRAKI